MSSSPLHLNCLHCDQSHSIGYHLKTCGHSLCGVCIDDALYNNALDRTYMFVKCPLCERLTDFNVKHGLPQRQITVDAQFHQAY